LVARLLATAALGSIPEISQKYKTGDISKGVANTLLPAVADKLECNADESEKNVKTQKW
jgi:hypothetical protein